MTPCTIRLQTACVVGQLTKIEIAELLIDLEEDKAARAVVFGLREMERK
jgi:hypothetical protein